MMSKKYTSKPFSLTTAIRKVEFKRAELVFHKVDHSGPSYEGRVYFNNPGASEKTPLTLESGYAGCFTIFGHGQCWGDKGHCMVPEKRRDFDQRSPHGLTPREVVVNVTEALKRVSHEKEKLSITVVPVIMATRNKKDVADCFHFNKLSIRIRSFHGLLEDPYLKNTTASGND